MKLKFKTLFLATTLAVSIGTLSSCDKPEDDDNTVKNEEELITTVELTLVDTAFNVSETYVWKDEDGEGGNAPSRIDTLKLPANRNLVGSVSFYDDSKTPREDITEEIIEEANEHFVGYTPSGGLNLSVDITDKDGNNLPLGLANVFRPGSESAGSIKITLKHQTGGVKDGTLTPGETDVEVDFPVEIR